MTSAKRNEREKILPGAAYSKERRRVSLKDTRNAFGDGEISEQVTKENRWIVRVARREEIRGIF